MSEKKNNYSNYWLQTLILNNENEKSRDKIIKYLKKKYSNKTSLEVNSHTKTL